VAGSRDRRSQEVMVHPFKTSPQETPLNVIPPKAMTNFTTSCMKITVLLITFPEVNFLVTMGWIPNWRARRAMKRSALGDREEEGEVEVVVGCFDCGGGVVVDVLAWMPLLV